MLLQMFTTRRFSMEGVDTSSRFLSWIYALTRIKCIFMMIRPYVVHTIIHIHLKRQILERIPSSLNHNPFSYPSLPLHFFIRSLSFPLLSHEDMKSIHPHQHYRVWQTGSPFTLGKHATQCYHTRRTNLANISRINDCPYSIFHSVK